MMGWCPNDGEECRHDGYCKDCEHNKHSDCQEGEKSMTRDEAIDWIGKICAYLTSGNPIWRNEPIIEACDMAIDALKAEPQWIPCERELPEVGRSVLISVGGMYTAEGCLREDGDWAQFRWDAIQRKDMVGAWKPLDEPWRGANS